MAFFFDSSYNTRKSVIPVDARGCCRDRVRGCRPPSPGLAQMCARHEISLRIARVPHTDVAVRIEDLMRGENAVRRHDIVDLLRCVCCADNFSVAAKPAETEAISSMHTVIRRQSIYSASGCFFQYGGRLVLVSLTICSTARRSTSERRAKGALVSFPVSTSYKRRYTCCRASSGM
jgi:hypothetical protein